MKKINLGSAANAGNGDTGRSGGGKLNDNFKDVVSAIAGYDLWATLTDEAIPLSGLNTTDKTSLIAAINETLSVQDQIDDSLTSSLVKTWSISKIDTELGLKLTTASGVAYDSARLGGQLPSYYASQTNLNTAIATSAYGIKYSWADSTARAAQTGMVALEQGVQLDTREVYHYDGSVWALFYTLDGVHNHDDRYYTESESDGKYLLNTTDTLTGDLAVTGDVGLGGTGLYTASNSLNIDGTGLAIKNDLAGSSNNWSSIKNTATANDSNFVFTTGSGVALTLAHNTDATFGGTVDADSFDASGKIFMGTDGTLSWGAAQDYGKLTYDTGKIIIRGQSGKAIEFQTNGSTEALTLSTSQNATFAGDVTTGGTTILNIMPTNASEGYVRLGRSDGNTSRYHDIKSYVSSTAASNYLKFSLHTGTANTVADVLTLNGDGDATFAGEVTISAETQYLNFTKASTSDILATIVGETDAGTGGKLRFLTKRNGDTQLNALIIDDNQNATFGGEVLLPSGNYLSWGTSGATSIEGSTASNKLQFRTSSTDRMIINDDGVGIGNSNPTIPLVVGSGGDPDQATIAAFINANNGGEASIMLQNDAGGGSTDETNVIVSRTSNRRNGRILFGREGDQSSAANADSFLALYTAKNNTDTERLRIDSDGNVGIGTATPNAKLTIVAPDVTVNPAISLRQTNSSVQGWDIDIENNSIGRLDISGVGASAKVQAISILKASGNVGIGTTSPDAKLDVEAAHSQLRLTDSDDNKYALFSYSSSYLSIRNNSTSAVHWALDVNGNVGIGITNPSSYDSNADNLVIGSIGASDKNGITIVGGDTDGRGAIYFADTTQNSAGYITYLHSDNSMLFGTSDTTRIVVDSDGNVGIGTTDPDYPLDVSFSGHSGIRAISTSGDSRLYLTAASTTNSSTIAFGDSDEANQGVITYDHSADAMKFITSDTEQMRISDNLITFASTGVNEIRADVSAGKFAIGNMGDSTSQMMVSSRGFLTFNVSNTGSAKNATERMRIDSAGNVGIGRASNLNDALTISKSDSDSTFGTTNAAIEITNSNASVGKWSGLNFRVATGTYGESLACVQALYEGWDVTVKGALAFGTRESGYGAVTERMRIDSSGNVGIGTDNPVYGLDVRSTIYTSVADTTKNLTLGDSTNGTSSAISTNNNNLNFYYDGSTESMSLDSSGATFSGNIDVGSTSTRIEIKTNGDAFTPQTGAWQISGTIANTSYPSYGFYGNTGVGMYRPAADALGFVSNGTERLRIDSSGNFDFKTGAATFGDAVRINGTTTNGLVIASSSGGSSGLKLSNNSTTDTASILNHYDGDLIIGTNNAAVLTMNGTTSTFAGKVRANSWYQGASGTNTLWAAEADGILLDTPGSTASNNNSKIFFRNSGNIVKHTFDTNNGNATFAGTVTATNFILSSDKRLKENISPVMQESINVDWKNFNMKGNSEKRYGVIAQDLEKTNPEFVRTAEDGMKSVAYIDLLIAKIAELENRLTNAKI